MAIVAWIAIWQIVAIIIHNRILLAGPIETVQTLIRLAGEEQFW
jgi:NitT/TauT family transport system permease protein